MLLIKEQKWALLTAYALPFRPLSRFSSSGK